MKVGFRSLSYTHSESFMHSPAMSVLGSHHNSESDRQVWPLIKAHTPKEKRACIFQCFLAP